MAAAGDSIAECQCAVGDGAAVHGTGAGIRADILPVVGNSHFQFPVAQDGQQELGLHAGLLRRNCLGEEVYAHVQSGGFGAGQMTLEAVVQEQSAFSVSPIAHPDHRKIHAGGRYLLPVDDLLVLRHVDTQPGFGSGAAEKPVIVFKILSPVGVRLQYSCVGFRGIGGGGKEVTQQQDQLQQQDHGHCRYQNGQGLTKLTGFLFSFRGAHSQYSKVNIPLSISYKSTFAKSLLFPSCFAAENGVYYICIMDWYRQNTILV